MFTALAARPWLRCFQMVTHAVATVMAMATPIPAKAPAARLPLAVEVPGGLARTVVVGDAVALVVHALSWTQSQTFVPGPY